MQLVLPLLLLLALLVKQVLVLLLLVAELPRILGPVPLLVARPLPGEPLCEMQLLAGLPLVTALPVGEALQLLCLPGRPQVVSLL